VWSLRPRRWRQVLRRLVSASNRGLDKTFNPQGRTVAKKSPIAGGARRKTVIKTIGVRERPGDSGVPRCYSCAFLPLPSAHEAAGAKGIRRSPTPSLGVKIHQHGLGRMAVGGTKKRVSRVEARTSQPVVPANAGIHNHRTSVVLAVASAAVFQFTASRRMGPGVSPGRTKRGWRSCITPIPLPPLIFAGAALPLLDPRRDWNAHLTGADITMGPLDGIKGRGHDDRADGALLPPRCSATMGRRHHQDRKTLDG